MAISPAAIYSCLARDTSIGIVIGDELMGTGTTMQEVASTFAVIAAAILAEACGGTAEARRLAAQVDPQDHGPEARTVIARKRQ